MCHVRSTADLLALFQSSCDHQFGEPGLLVRSQVCGKPGRGSHALHTNSIAASIYDKYHVGLFIQKDVPDAVLQ